MIALAARSECASASAREANGPTCFRGFVDHIPNIMAGDLGRSGGCDPVVRESLYNVGAPPGVAPRGSACCLHQFSLWTTESTSGQAQLEGTTGKEGEMPMRILVPLDGSSFSEQAVSSAYKIALLSRVTVHLARVIRPGVQISAEVGSSENTAVNDLREQAEEYLQQQAGRAPLGIATRMGRCCADRTPWRSCWPGTRPRQGSTS